jgi:ABC-type Fe3+ transport system permease subunit
MTKSAGQKAEKGAKRKGGFKLIFVMTLIGCFIPFGIPTLLVGLGLTPTLVALATDTDEKRSGLATIGYLNFAGVLPFWIDLWTNGQSMDVAMRIIRDPYSWVIMLGAAGIGHLILYTVPPTISIFVRSRQEARLDVLREGIKQLEAIWGPDVMTMVPIEVVRKNKGVQ